jgi:predicted ATPase
MTPRLSRVRVAGFRSVKDVTLEATNPTILIGPNSAGKSNILWALQMLRALADEALQLFVGERGGAPFLMHYGPAVTEAIELRLTFATDEGEKGYDVRLVRGANESLVLQNERVGVAFGPAGELTWQDLGSGHRESRLGAAAQTDSNAKAVRSLLRQIQFYHFADTSRRSALRTRDFAGVGGASLTSDGSNLPAFLLWLRASDEESDQAAWRLIEALVRRVAPAIKTLEPEEDAHGVQLRWIDDAGHRFGPAHLSDGTLRAIALIAALAQPSSTAPIVSCFDEPELGLHPAAFELLCGLISSATVRRQLILSTQSPVLLDHFDASKVVVAERHESATKLTRLDPEALEHWLEEYSLSELYDKNVLGGPVTKNVRANPSGSGDDPGPT